MLDVDELITGGWRPTPFRQFLLKVHSRCNLSCDYCYVYTLADQSWRLRPLTMEPSVLALTARRIANHARAHNLDAVRIILHGGEPLLAGRSYLADAVSRLRQMLEPVVRVHMGLQTNGILLDEDFLRMFRSFDVRVGVSLDGNRAAHDRHRRYAGGSGSHAAVSQALRLLMRPEYREVYSGLLCTIDLRNDPITVYEAMLGFDPPAVDFLLPHGTWSAPPPGRDCDPTHAPYAEWLIAVFDRWYGSPRRETRVRLFEEIIHLLLGGASQSEAVGLTPTSLVVIETDGSIEQADTLKSAYDGAPATGLHVARDSFDAALRLPSIVARQLGLDALADDCTACPLRRVCGGGLYSHRYRVGSGFHNPSVYCPDLFRLIDHIRERVVIDLRARAGTAR
jgi:uncharacterized protein